MDVPSGLSGAIVWYLAGEAFVRRRPCVVQSGPLPRQSVDVQLIDILRFGDDGLAHEHWGVMDALGLMQQLGVAPQ